MDGLRITDHVIDRFPIREDGGQHGTLVETTEDIWLELTMMVSSDFWRVIFVQGIGYVVLFGIFRPHFLAS